MRTLIVAGGGTGGHVLAGVAVADAWKARFGGEARVLFVGARGGIEEKLVPKAGYPLTTLALGSLNRVSFSRKLKTAVQLPLSLIRSALVLARERPGAVLGVGGYASGPLVLIARFLSAFGLCGKTAILEQNSVPGFTNRILGKCVHEVLCAFPGTEARFPGARTRITGNPVRKDMKPLPRATRDPFTVFVFGGSQGAAGINTLVLDALSELGPDLARFRFIHQTGEKDYERVRAGHESAGSGARVEKFIYDMAQCYAQASLVICRAGSSTLAELAAVGRAAVLVPFPFASDNHQEANARVFVDRGAARLVLQQKAQGRDLAVILREMLGATAAIDAMEESIRAFYRPEAASDVVQSLLER